MQKLKKNNDRRQRKDRGKIVEQKIDEIYWEEKEENRVREEKLDIIWVRAEKKGKGNASVRQK